MYLLNYHSTRTEFQTSNISHIWKKKLCLICFLYDTINNTALEENDNTEVNVVDLGNKLNLSLKKQTYY